jgi:hypothetical protein
MSTSEILISLISGGLSITLGYFLGRSKMRAEVSKILAETKTITDNHEINLSEFYKQEVLELIQEVKALKAEIEKERIISEECYESIAALRQDYDILLAEVNKLKAKHKNNDSSKLD